MAYAIYIHTGLNKPIKEKVREFSSLIEAESFAEETKEKMMRKKIVQRMMIQHPNIKLVSIRKVK